MAAAVSKVLCYQTWEPLGGAIEIMKGMQRSERINVDHELLCAACAGGATRRFPEPSLSSLLLTATQVGYNTFVIT